MTGTRKVDRIRRSACGAVCSILANLFISGVAMAAETSSIDRDGTRDVMAAYRAGKLDLGDSLAARYGDPIARTAMEWIALHDGSPRIGLDRLQAFAAKHPDWPTQPLLHRLMEARQLAVKDPIAVETFFTTAAPETPLGKLALARALKATGRVSDGTKLARAVFRESDMTGYAESLLKAEFGGDLTKADYKYRADRLLYDGKNAAALHAAAYAGPDVLALAKARAAVNAEAASDAAIAAVPETLRDDPGLILARVQKLRRADKPLAAAWLMETAPHDATRLIDGDEWWAERRLLARKLLDAGKPKAAYVMCAMNSAVSREAKIEAEFHAGWIALRFLHEPARAAYHFNVAAGLAKTPTSIARIAYWQGRTAEAEDASDKSDRAKAYYTLAAVHGSTYHGQLARQALGLPPANVQEPPAAATGDERADALRVIELLYDLGEKDAANTLAVDAANGLNDERQVGALAALIAGRQDAHLSLVVGKIVGQRGMPADSLAFPTFGVPAYIASASSASQTVVYSVVRQESAFIASAKSKAGAKGLMQMIDSTARHTAVKEKLRFDSGRMIHDAAFNARLGAAHLGELLAEQKGSLILTFAAYNAGGGRVKQWIDAYGDPREPDVDPIDWVERIPFGETRNYVQRVLANVAMYEALFAGKAKPPIIAKSAREARL